VLIPRPETEHVIEAALGHVAGARTIVDIGTGSGAIAVTLAIETGARVAATDLSAPAVRVASSNAGRLGARVDFAVCDLGAALRDERFDLVVSNPPYVPEGDSASLRREIREHEPALALYGGADGFDVYRRLIPEARRLLRPGGWLIMELAYNAADHARELLEGWQEVTVTSDLAGLPRVVSARRP
jgi:release factor glutamine methyltransferase